MILPGTRKVKPETIVVPRGFGARKKAPHHESRKASIKKHGLINLIVIQDRTKKLLAGGDRLAAVLALKVKQIEVRVFRGSEEEFEALQLAENIERRHNDDVDAMTKRYVELTTGEIEKAEQSAIEDACIEAIDNVSKLGGTPDFVVHDGVQYDTREPAPVGRPKTAKGKAREAVAAATGKTPEAIRQAEKRANAAERKAAAPPPAEPATPTCPVETYGLPLVRDDETLHLLAAQSALSKIEKLLRQAQGFAGNEDEGGPLFSALLSPIRAQLREATADVRDAVPVAVCAHCKRIPKLQTACVWCSRTGFIGAEEARALPDELRLGGDQAVVDDGNGGLVPYAREAAKPAKEERAAKSKPAKGARRLTVTMDDGAGNETPFTE